MNRNELISRLLAACLIVAMIGSFAMAASANNSTTPPGYYENNSTPETDSWMDDNETATIHNAVKLATRVGTFVVGDEQGSTVGAILMSLVLGGMVIGLVGASSVGAVAGSVVVVISVGAFATMGIIDSWIWAVTLFVLGMVVTSILKRTYG